MSFNLALFIIVIYSNAGYHLSGEVTKVPLR